MTTTTLTPSDHPDLAYLHRRIAEEFDKLILSRRVSPAASERPALVSLPPPTAGAGCAFSETIERT